MNIEEVIKSSRPIEDQYHRAFLNVVYSGIWLEQNTLDPLKQRGLSHPQYNVLRIVKGYKAPMTVASIQQRMLYQTSNVTRIIDKLVEKGLLVKESSNEDRRVVLVNITAAGLEKLKELHDLIYGSVKQIVGKNLSIDETIMLGALLDKMRS